MSFRNRLTLFFVVIVVVPMVAVAVVLLSLVDESERGRAGARLDEAQMSVAGLYRMSRERAAPVARRIGGDAGLAEAIRAGDRERIAERLTAAIRRHRAQAARLELPGEEPVFAGAPDAIARKRTQLMDEGEPSGMLSVSVVRAPGLAEEARETTALDRAVIDPRGRVLASTVDDLPGTLRGKGETRVGSTDYRYVTVDASGFGDEQLRIPVLLNASAREEGGGSRWVAAAVAVFLLMALGFALVVSRSLQLQIHRLLEAARRIGRGDFRIAVPTEGHDEFAQLGQEFNAMAGQLEERLADLRRERGRLQEAIRRVGASFAKGLDREGVLTIVVETAVDGTGSLCGRTMMQPAPGILRLGAAAGTLDGHEPALRAAEASALQSKSLEEVSAGGVVAMAHPMRSEQSNRILGVLSVGRAGGAFSEADHDLLQYLAGQAAVSIENVALHETVQRQAVTDELTGLFNHRQFQEVVTAEVERTRRFGQRLGLIMLDIDNFKRVNDSHGHMQGDLVLREVARVLRETAREIDIPARYGGEEMAVVLPQTDMEGAYRFAERVRRRIQRLDLPLLDRSGTLQVTASLGVASVPGSAPADKDALVGAADAALYRAKREGKNRTERADPVPAPDPA